LWCVSVLLRQGEILCICLWACYGCTYCFSPCGCLASRSVLCLEKVMYFAIFQHLSV
jgi:hypothetical protein